jgi:antitoxin HicB
MEHEYTVILEPQPEGGYTVTVPALPGCITEGDTVEEALAMAQEAVALYLEDYKETGQPFPDNYSVVKFVRVVA